MNHQTAKIIAQSYREQARAANGGAEDRNPLTGLGEIGYRDRATLLYDHAAVWERVAHSIARDEYPVGPEAPRVQ